MHVPRHSDIRTHTYRYCMSLWCNYLNDIPTDLAPNFWHSCTYPHTGSLMTRRSSWRRGSLSIHVYWSPVVQWSAYDTGCRIKDTGPLNHRIWGAKARARHRLESESSWGPAAGGESVGWRLRAGANMPLSACPSIAVVSPSGPYVTGPRDETASSIANLLSMACYGCSAHSRWLCSVQPVVRRESPMDIDVKKVMSLIYVSSRDLLQVIFVAGQYYFW